MYTCLTFKQHLTLVCLYVLAILQSTKREEELLMILASSYISGDSEISERFCLKTWKTRTYQTSIEELFKIPTCLIEKEEHYCVSLKRYFFQTPKTVKLWNSLKASAAACRRNMLTKTVTIRPKTLSRLWPWSCLDLTPCSNSWNAQEVTFKGKRNWLLGKWIKRTGIPNAKCFFSRRYKMVGLHQSRWSSNSPKNGKIGILVVPSV